MEGYRLAAQQKHLWGLGDAPGLRTAATVAIEGDLDPRRLRAALEEVAGRHQALRTHLRPWEGYRFPVQVIDGSPGIEWRELDAGDPDGDPVAPLGLAPFDLAQDALVRASLVREGPGRHRLFLVLPALAADAASLGLLFGELVAAYGDGPGRGPGEDDVVQFLQVSEWQNALAEDEDRDDGEEHWRRRLEDAPILRLPYERVTGPGEGAPFAPEVVTAPVDDPALLAGAAQALGCDSVDQVALAAWVCVLRRLTGRADLLVERVFPGRGIEELSEVFGLLARSLPLRLRIEPGFRFDEVVRRLGEEIETAERWQPYHPRFEGGRSVVPPRDEALLFEGVEWPPPAEAAGATFSLHRPVAGTDRFKAKLVCARQGDAVSLELHHDPRRLGTAEAGCLLGQVRECLASAAEDPARRLDELSLLPAETRSRMVARAVPRTPEPPSAPAVHELFERWAAETPGAPAVTSGGERLTYGELDRRSAALALRLRRAGVRRGDPVALHLERSLDVVVAVLGALRAGGAFAPLDMGSPPGRLSRMLGELGHPVLVTQERLLDRLPEGSGEVVVMDRPEGEDDGASPAPPAHPEDLAYVLFTSGSTGEPKGVMVEHRQLAGYVLAVSERMALPAGSRYAMVSTFAADLGHTALFPALCTGGCVDVVPEERAAEADAFGEYLAAHPVDALKIVPSHLGALLSAAQPERCLPRRLLVVGGEAVGWDLVEKAAALAPECRILNHYGPTETTVGALAADLDPASPDRGAAPPLGTPIAHASACVLDPAFELAPVGVPGELFLGGAGVSRGYLGAPAATAAAFLPHPLAGRPGERVYRSGDLARSRPDGDLEFLGRRDHQVKIRGFRVELSEIEATLRRHPAVREAVVGLHGEPAAEASVVAWWVRRGDRPATSAELRAHLLERLPRHMVPAGFVEIEALPRTANGKIDRAALPAPDAAARAAAGAGEPPATPVEEVIAGYWEELLRVPRVGREGHFFELGGHSLVATQLVARLREAFGIDLRLRQLFDAPTLVGLAAEVEAALHLHRPVEVPPIQPVPRQPGAGLPLSFGQRRLWLSQTMDPESSAYNIPTSLGVDGPLSVARLQAALTELVRRQEVLRTSFREVDGEPLQFVEPLRPVPVPVVDLRPLPEPARAAEAERLAALYARVPFDLESGRPLRMRVLRLDEESHMLLFLVHHVASDAWSNRVLVREVVGHYEDLAAGRPSRLPQPPIQYADFAAWQRRWLSPEALPAEVEFWRRELADLPPPPELADRPRPPVMTHRGASRSRTLEGELVEEVRGLARSEGATSFMALLAALQVVLSHRSGSEDVLVGTNVAGRSQTAIEGLVGFFLNMIVLRTDLGGDPTFAELLRRVRDTAVQAFAHQDLPFDQVVERVAPRRDPGRHPLFQVKLDYQRLPGGPGAPAELALRPLELDYATSHCDLTLYVEDVDDRLRCSLEYNADLFEERTALEMLDQYRTVLELAAAEPGIRLAELRRALAEGEERHRQTAEEEFRETRLRGLRSRTRRDDAEKPSQMEVGS